MTNSNGKIQVADKFKHLPTQHNLTDSIRGGEFHSIVTRDKIWRLRSGGVLYDFVDNHGAPLKELDVVIVNIHPANSRTYYPGTFQSESSNPPTCASLMGVVPDPGVPIPQHRTCNGCPHDQWGPNKTGKECKEHKRVAVVLLPSMKTRPAMEKPLNKPVFFKVPTASMKIFKPYIDWLMSQGVPFASVITRCTFNEKKWEILFDYYKSLTNADADLILPLTEPEATRHILGNWQEFKQIPSVAAPALEQETGFAAAFGRQEQAVVQAAAIEPTSLPIKRGPGRPRKMPEEAKPPEDGGLIESAPEPADAGQAGQDSAFEDVENSELDSMMADVLGDKVNKSMS
jgi:hypothetical protein